MSTTTMKRSDGISPSANKKPTTPIKQAQVKEQKEPVINEENIVIKRTSSCGGYKTKIKGLNECANRSGVSVEDLKKALKTGESLHGFYFKEI